jgi:hypothetical protein
MQQAASGLYLAYTLCTSLPNTSCIQLGVDAQPGCNQKDSKTGGQQPVTDVDDQLPCDTLSQLGEQSFSTHNYQSRHKILPHIYKSSCNTRTHTTVVRKHLATATQLEKATVCTDAHTLH